MFGEEDHGNRCPGNLKMHKRTFFFTSIHRNYHRIELPLRQRESIKLIPLECSAHAHRRLVLQVKMDPRHQGTQKGKGARMSDVSVIMKWFLGGTP